MKTLFCSFCCTLLTVANLLGQSLNTSIGPIKQMIRKENGATFITSNATAEVTVYSSTVVRLRIYQSNAKDFSYAVVGGPAKTSFSWNEAKEAYTLATDSIQLKIFKQPFRVAFYTHKGVLLNQDEPAFGTSWIGNEVTTYKKLQEGERFIGLGEKTGNLDRRGRAYVNWNNDYYGYPVNADPLYESIPFYIGIHHQCMYGLFFDNTYKTTFNFGASNKRFSSFAAEEGEMNYYLIGNSTVSGIIESYTALTGRTPLPPLWSLGFQQCRYSYFPDKEVITLAQTFRDKAIPADVLYFDIHYMEDYKIFTWHSKRFPEPKKMLDQLEKLGFHVVVIVDPGIKVEKGYPAYEEGLKKDYFVKYPDDSLYTAEVWPSWAHFPDFTYPKVRSWWGEQFKAYINDGIDGFWNDMNEPASWGNKTPDLVQFHYEGNKSTHKRAHNIYGMQMARSTYEGTRKEMNGKRPFILTRAGYSGVQRYSAVWTGDNVASDEHMLLGVRLVNSMGLSGIPFAGPDVGGFVGDPSSDLYLRWMSIGTYTPFFRAHSMIGSKDREPFAFGEEVEDAVRRSLEKRYQLLPYLYAAFYESSQTGIPVARSLAINYPYDSTIYLSDYQHQYLFGPNIMVAPVVSTQKFTRVYFPKGTWYKMDTDEQISGNKELIVDAALTNLPVFAKEGAIIPMQSVIQSTHQKPSDTLYIHLYPTVHSNQYVYYEDDGETYAYEKGDYLKATISLDGQKQEITWKKNEGNRKSKFTIVKVVCHRFDTMKAAQLEDKTLRVESNGGSIKTFSIPISDYFQIRWQ